MKGHAESPSSLDAIGRGMMKKFHPHEIRIPDIFNSFTGPMPCSSVPNSSRSSSYHKPLRGRGRGSQLVSGPSSKQPRLSSRDRRIGKSLDSKNMDIQEGKGFIMEKFLGLHPKEHVRLSEQGANSHSSGNSRRTCPAKLGVNKLNREEWPELSWQNSPHTQKPNSTQPNDGKQCQGKTSPLAIDQEGTGIQRSYSDGNFRVGNHTPEAFSKAANEMKQVLPCIEKFDESSTNSKLPSGRNSASEGADSCVGIKMANVGDGGQRINSSAINDNNNHHRQSKPTVTVDDTNGSRNSSESNGTVGGMDGGNKAEPLEGGPNRASDSQQDQEGAVFSLNDLGQTLRTLPNGGEVQVVSQKLEGHAGVQGKEPLAGDGEDGYRLFVANQFQPGDLSPLRGPNVLQVEGLPPAIKDDDVTDLFFICGTVTDCKVLRDADTKLCIGIAYVRLEESTACAMAVSSLNDEPSPFFDHHDDEDDIPKLKVQLFEQS